MSKGPAAFRPVHRLTGVRTQDWPDAGREDALVAINAHSRIAFSAIHPGESAKRAGTALLQAHALLRPSGGIRYSHALTGKYRSRRLRRPRPRLGIEHKRFSPRTPQTKGTPRRFIQTPLREWVHVRAYETLSLHTRRFPYRFPFWLREYS